MAERKPCIGPADRLFAVLPWRARSCNVPGIADTRIRPDLALDLAPGLGPSWCHLALRARALKRNAWVAVDHHWQQGQQKVPSSATVAFLNAGSGLSMLKLSLHRFEQNRRWSNQPRP